MNVRKLYSDYRTRSRELETSILPDEAFSQALRELAETLNHDLSGLTSKDREALCDDLGVQLENELYRATSTRQRKILVALLKVLDSQD